MDASTKQMGNNMHDGRRAPRGKSPDDPDSQPRPGGQTGPGGVNRQDAERKLNVGDHDTPENPDNQAAEPDDAIDKEIQEAEENLARVKQRQAQQGGRRTLSAFGALEEVDAYSTREAAEGQEEDYTTLGGVMHAGARGAGRKLMNWRRNAVKQVDARRRSRAEIDKDAARERDAHRAGHGHHLNRKRKEAKTQEQEEEEKQGERTLHHHRSFHPKEEVPNQERHHVHPGYHHGPGDEKLPGGWRHQHKEWGTHEHVKLLGTRFNLGRSKTRKRKELLENYIFKRGPVSRHKSVEFSDSKRWRAQGLWMMIIGTMSIAFCLVIGNFQPRPKMKKVS